MHGLLSSIINHNETVAAIDLANVKAAIRRGCASGSPPDTQHTCHRIPTAAYIIRKEGSSEVIIGNCL